MSNECSHDCGSCSSKCADAIQKDALHPLAEVKKVIAVVSGKGGVGKSIVTSLMSVIMQRRGYNSAILDADITGPSVPKAFGITEKAEGTDTGLYPVTSKLGTQIMSVNVLLENETDPVIWRGPVIAGTVKQFWTDVIWNDVDYMFVDMPPGTGDVPLTVFQSLPVDGLIVVTSPQELVSMIVGKAVKMAEMMKIPVIGLVENMSYAVCPDCGKHINVFGLSHIDETAQKFGLKVLAKLPINPELAVRVDNGSIEGFDCPEAEPIADAAEAITK